MKKTLLVSALALAVGLALVPALAPAQADAATIYLQQSYEHSSNVNGSWQKDFTNKNTYNKKNLTTKTVAKNYNEGKVASTTKTTYTYDSKGRTKTSKTYNNGKLESKSKYTYKKNKTTIKTYKGKKYQGKRVEKITSKKHSYIEYNTKGKKVANGYTTYDKKGNMKVSKDYSNGKIGHVTKNKIKKGKIVESVYKSYENGKLDYSYKNTYSYKGKYRTEKGYDSDGKMTSMMKSYEDKAGYTITVWEKWYNDGKMTSKMTYKAKKYKSGKLKGVVKQLTRYSDGKAESKTIMKYKAVKAK